MTNKLLEDQILRENSKREEAINKYLNTNLDDAHGNILIKLGYKPFRDKLEEYKQANLKGMSVKRRNFLELICDDYDVIAYSTLNSVISVLSRNKNTTMKTPIVSRKIIEALMEVHFFNRLKSDNPKLHAYLGQEYRAAGSTRKKMLLDKHIKSLQYDNILQDKRSEVVIVGSMLLHILELSGANLIESVTLKSRGKSASHIRLTEEAQHIIIDLYHRGLQVSIQPSYLPMVHPPKDWESNKGGGYYTDSNFNLFTLRTKLNRQFFKDKHLPQIYSVVNKIQKVGWRINTRVLDVVEAVFKGNLIDPANPNKFPRCYGGIPTSNVYKAEELLVKEDYGEWADYNRAREKLKIGLDGENGRRLGLIFALDVANQIKEYEAIYFPYQLDYRGRLYCATNHINPQSPKHIKALLEFSEGKYLDKEGEYWLKVHVANCYGIDKAPFEDRIKWVEENESIILAIASDPLDNIKHWAYCDSPFEYLAGCIAYKDSVEGLPVYTPIQLDATCSGIQFYSGLLLDKEGAESVNVIGQERNDIYQKVADKVNELLEEGKYPKTVTFRDSEGVERTVNTYEEARSLKGNITRSLVKRNTMTVPYSVTLRGMSDQLWDEMEDMELKGKAFWKGDRWVVNKLLTYLNHTAIYSVVKGAKLGQDYFTAVSSTIKEPAVWETPLYGFPIIQPALKDIKKRIKTPLGSLLLKEESPKFSLGKQKQGIAPNIIHSLDAELLRFVIDNMNGDIGVIHDCFLVHPNDGEQVRNLYKEGYVQLMSTNPIAYIGRQIDKEGKVEVPCIGDLDLQDVYDSMYIIS